MPISYGQRIFDALPGTYLELIERGFASRGTVYLWIKRYRAEGKCHIGGWKRTEGRGGSYQPVFVAGPGKDVACRFKQLTSKQYNARYFKKLKATDQLDEFRTRKAVREHARYTVKKAQAGKLVDPITAALCKRAA